MCKGIFSKPTATTQGRHQLWLCERMLVHVLIRRRVMRRGDARALRLLTLIVRHELSSPLTSYTTAEHPASTP